MYNIYKYQITFDNYMKIKYDCISTIDVFRIKKLSQSKFRIEKI